MADSVTFLDGALEFHTRKGRERVTVDEITQVDLCHLAEREFQGDEEFHVVHFTQAFWLIGPFVTGGIKAIRDLLTAHPDTPIRDCTVHKVPWAFRERGWFGLRLFPTPGFVRMPMSRLPELRISLET